MKRSHETWPLVSVFHYKNQINPTPKYQRWAVWDRPQKQLLMDSIYRGIDIPKLYLGIAEENGEGFDWEAIDGQQRLRAVWDFFDNKYPLSDRFTPELGGKLYKDLPPKERQRFELYQFNLVIIEEAEDAEIREMFCRLQNGKPLNAAEKRNAMLSKMRDFCAEMGEHPFFNAVRFGNKRMQFQQVAAQTVLLELEGGPTYVKNTNLAKLYEEYANFDSGSAPAKRVRHVYDYLQKAFPERTPELKRGYVVSLYLLVSQLMKDYNLKGHEADLKNFLIEFDYLRRTQTDNVDMVKFTERMSHASDAIESLTFRHKMLLELFHAKNPDLIPLDSQRAFDEHQRIAIYRRDGGKCKYCGDLVPWEKFQADHIVPHNAGGPTTVENGRLACSTCNKSKGGQILATSMGS